MKRVLPLTLLKRRVVLVQLGSTKTKAIKQVVNRIATLGRPSMLPKPHVPNAVPGNIKIYPINLVATRAVRANIKANWAVLHVLRIPIARLANTKQLPPPQLPIVFVVVVLQGNTNKTMVQRVVQPAVPINTKMKWAKPVVNLASPVISPILVKLHVLDVLPVNTTAVECAKIAKVANIKTNRTKAVANPTVMSVTTLTAIKRLVYRVVRGNTKMKTTKQAVAKLIVPPVITLKTIKRRVCLVVWVNTKTKAIN